MFCYKNYKNESCEELDKYRICKQLQNQSQMIKRIKTIHYFINLVNRFQHNVLENFK